MWTSVYICSQGVTHVLNTAEQHVSVSQSKLAKAGIQYFGFHVDDLPHCNIGRYFPSTTEFIHRAVTGGGLVAVNCYVSTALQYDDITGTTNCVSPDGALALRQLRARLPDGETRHVAQDGESSSVA